jgi:hypothetical protein
MKSISTPQWMLDLFKAIDALDGPYFETGIKF